MCMGSKCSDVVPAAGVALASDGAAAAGVPVVPAAGDGKGTPVAAQTHEDLLFARRVIIHSQFTAWQTAKIHFPAGARLPLHWLAGGAWTLHAPGSCSARALSTATPSDAAVPPSTMQRHRGLDCSTPDSAEQHGPSGAVTFPDM
jgi:hypothetical protein